MSDVPVEPCTWHDCLHMAAFLLAVRLDPQHVDVMPICAHHLRELRRLLTNGWRVQSLNPVVIGADPYPPGAA